MVSENETIADIVAQIRAAAYIQNADPPESVFRLADRIEAAWKRERESLLTKQGENVNSGSAVYTGENKGGNAAAMREALKKIYSLAQAICDYKEEPAMVYLRADLIERAVNAALSAPPRNCDLFSSYGEAVNYWHENVECAEVNGCFDVWLFAPSAERKGECDGR